MNEKFLELPKEKQLRIINAGMEYFGKYGYKNASTDDIAAKADISKGLLFYYFHNKKSFYLYLYHFCVQLMHESIRTSNVRELTDFFEIFDCGAQLKLKLIMEYPYLMDFVLNAYYSQKEAVTDDIHHLVEDIVSVTFEVYFQNVNWNKFKEGIDPRQIYQMLLWMADGYMLDKQRRKEKVEIDEMMNQFNEWKYMFKKICYREEYL